jgi:hypothetical protein
MCRSSHPEDDGEESVHDVVARFFRKKFRDCVRIACDACCCDWKQKNVACNCFVRVNTFNLQCHATGQEILLLLLERRDTVRTGGTGDFNIAISQWYYIHETIPIRSLCVARDFRITNSQGHAR